MKQKEILSAYTGNTVIRKVVLLVITLASTCLAQFGDFGGPSILSRGGAKPGQVGGQPVSFNFYAGINGNFNTGSIPLAIDSQGNSEAVDLYGGSFNVGLTGSHAWRKASLGVDYRGNYRKYSRHTYADGTEQAIDLQYTLQATRRVALHLTEVGGTSNLAYGGFISPTATLDSNLFGVPTNNIFDNRMSYFQSGAGLSYRQNARLSYDFSGDVFTVHRASRQLVGMKGARASAQAQYQFSRRDQVGIGYSFTHFEYPRAFGASDLHGVNLQYSRRLRPGLNLQIGVGAFRIESLGTEDVALSPEVAAILGQNTGTKAVYRVNYIPQYQAGITYAHARSTFTGSVNAGVTPGNGIYLTSRSENAGVGYSYSGIRKASLSFTGGVSQYSSVFQTLATFRSYYGGVSASYVLSRHLSATLQSDVRNFIITKTSRIGTTISIGLAWSPSEIPIPSW